METQEKTQEEIRVVFEGEAFGEDLRDAEVSDVIEEAEGGAAFERRGRPQGSAEGTLKEILASVSHPDIGLQGQGKDFSSQGGAQETFDRSDFGGPRKEESDVRFEAVEEEGDGLFRIGGGRSV